MPGLSGLETLGRIKLEVPDIPVIMITKNEEENIMDQAVGQKIADYLIKPVNPNQILLSIKKNLHSEELVSANTGGNYRQEFLNISNAISDCNTFDGWSELYSRLVYWEMELAGAETNMDEILEQQKREANAAFGRFVRHNYEDWVRRDAGSDQPGVR